MDEVAELFGKVTDGFVILEGSRIEYVNPAFARLLGQDARVVHGRPLEDWVVAGDWAGLSAWLEDPSGGVIEAGFIHHDGTARQLELTPIRGLSVGDRLRAGMLAVDVSRRQKMQVDLLVADRMMSVGALAGGVAHEINNPLSYVLGNLEFLQTELPDSLPSDVEGRSELIEALEECGEGAQRVRKIVSDFRAFARADPSSTRDLDLNRVVDLAVNMAFVEIRHRAKLVRNLQPVPSIHANEARVCQLVLNLLLNAAHALKPNTPENLIEVSTWVQGEHVFLSVEDNGPGIPDVLLSRLFEPFFTTKPAGIGNGLGLAISKAVVSELGGDINVESQFGRGSRFIVRLPPPRAAAESKRALRVLVVDDDPLVGDALKQLLSRDGSEVVVEASALEAKALLSRDRGFDAVLLDVLLPEVSGIELFRWVSDQDPALARKVGFMSVASSRPSAQAFVESVQQPMVEKPFSSEAVLRMVDKLVSG